MRKTTANAIMNKGKGFQSVSEAAKFGAQNLFLSHIHFSRTVSWMPHGNTCVLTAGSLTH